MRAALKLGPILTWTFNDPGEDPAYDGLNLLLDSLNAELDARETLAKEGKRQQLGDLFDGWRRVLEAREEAGRPTDGSRSSTSGWKAAAVPGLPSGRARHHRRNWRRVVSLGVPLRRPIDRGEITNRTDDTVVLRMTRPQAVLPARGVLLPFLGPSQNAINRQRDALTAVAAGQTANPDLRQIIDNPTVLEVGPPTEVTTWVRADLDQSKRDVVAHALGTQDLLLVEGPPGTGKTTVIAEIVEQTLSRHPTARILIVSQTHIAIDNALKRLEDAGITELVRLGRVDDPRVAESAQPLLLDRQVKKWTQGVRTRAERHLENVAAKSGQQPQPPQGGLGSGRTRRGGRQPRPRHNPTRRAGEPACA